MDPSKGRGRARGRTAVATQELSEPDLGPSGSDSASCTTELSHLAISAGRGQGEPMGAEAGDRNRGAAVGPGRPARRGRNEGPEIIIHTKPSHITSKSGTAGTPVTMVSNYYALNQIPNSTIYQYHCDFNPVVENVRDRFIYLKRFSDQLGNTYRFDGMQLFNIHKYPINPQVFTVTRETDNTPIRLTIQLVKELPPGDPAVLHFLNIAMRGNFRSLGLKEIQRNFFKTDGYNIPQHRLQVWPGFVTAIAQHETRVLMMADVAFKVLRTDTALDVIKRLMKENRPGDDVKVVIKKELLGQTIITRHNNKTYRIDDVNFDMSPLNTFTKDGLTISFKEYFRDRWTINVVDDYQPLLYTNPSAKDRRQGKVGIFHIPELCCMTGLTDKMRADFNIMRDIATYTRMRPEQRVRELGEFNKSLIANPEVQRSMQAWGVNFDNKLVEIQSRVLPPEFILQGDGVKYQSNAEWTREMNGKMPFAKEALKTWHVIMSPKDDDLSERLIRNFMNMFRQLGIEIGNPHVHKLDRDQASAYVSQLKSFQKSAVDLVLCTISAKSKEKYDAIKSVCCCDDPVVSQVVVTKTLRKNEMSVTMKIVLQVLAKIGGAPWSVSLPLDKAMIVGYDSYHDSSKRGLSVGGIVCTTKNDMTRYYSAVTFQTTHNELVDGFYINFLNGIKRYYALNGYLPNFIFIFRDGVGEGQIQTLVDYELPQITRVFSEFGDYKPKFAFIIVTKRVNTRFFWKRTETQYDNPPPGTVVDSIVTRPERYDFFLVSQKVNQGTVAPTHYNIISDSTGLSPEHMQRLAYKLTHLYYNWNGTIRVPAPCLFAHKLAFVTGQSLHKNFSNELQDKLFFL